MAEIFLLNGGPIADPREPRADVIKLAEQLLEAAKAGEVTGLVVALHYADGASGQRCAGVATYATVGRMESLKDLVLVGLRK